MTEREKVFNQMKIILEDKPNGVRSADLIRSIKEASPETNIHTIDGSIWSIKQKIDKGEITDVVKPERGLYILKKYLSQEKIEENTIKVHIENVVGGVIREIIKEENFYKPFSDYLVDDLGECTKAISLGGSKFEDKWGTPDVLGVFKIPETESFRQPTEIVSAEIKTDTTKSQLITAFGQACCYKIFSHKVYLVIPDDAERDIKRIESLCLKFGIGLVLFDKFDKNNPSFKIRTRAIRSEPDYFYVNEYMRKIPNELKKLF